MAAWDVGSKCHGISGQSSKNCFHVSSVACPICCLSNDLVSCGGVDINHPCIVTPVAWWSSPPTLESRAGMGNDLTWKSLHSLGSRMKSFLAFFVVSLAVQFVVFPWCTSGNVDGAHSANLCRRSRSSLSPARSPSRCPCRRLPEKGGSSCRSALASIMTIKWEDLAYLLISLLAPFHHRWMSSSRCPECGACPTRKLMASPLMTYCTIRICGFATTTWMLSRLK